MPPKAKGSKGSGPSDDDAGGGAAEAIVEADDAPSGGNVDALAAALTENITHQRQLNSTIAQVFTNLATRPPAALMDHDAFATALAPPLACAVDRVSGPKKIDPGHPGTEPFRSFSRPVFKPLPAAAEVASSAARSVSAH